MAGKHLPVRLQSAGEHLLVRLVEPSSLEWSEPFFRDAVPKNALKQSMQSVALWKEAQNPPDPDYSDLAIIAHVARCGSTLLARNVAASDQVVVLSEPPFFSALHGRLNGFQSESAALEISLLILGAWREWAKNQGKRLVLKLSSQLGPFLRLLQQQMPGARFVLIHREPLAVMESLDRKRTSRLQAEAEGAKPGIRHDLIGLDVDPYLLAAASSYLRSIDAMREMTDDTPRIAYADLAARYHGLLTALGLDPAKTPFWDGSINAKARGDARHAPYIPVPADRLEAFATGHAALLSHLESAYRRFYNSVDCQPTLAP